MRLAARHLWRQPLHRFPRPTTTRLHLVRYQTSQSGGGSNNGKQANVVSWSVPVVAIVVGAGATYWLMNPPANRKLQAAHRVTKAADKVPDLDALGLSLDIPHAPVPSPEDVTKKLYEHAFSLANTRVPGVSRYDGAQLASNAICEDAYVHGTFSNPFGSEDSKANNSNGNGNWIAWGIFDGHVGWQLADLLKRHLIPHVRRGLESIAVKSGAANPDDQAIDEAIKSSFTKLDDTIIKSAEATIQSNVPLAEKLGRLESAYAGACSLLTLYDPNTRKLKVALTGDCRAVLGRQNADGQCECVQLTVDQSGANLDEVARLQAQFPDEPEMVKGGRVWGIMPSRTFGDGMWKWPSALKKTLRDDYNAQPPTHIDRYPAYKDGPYLTAEPVITTIDIPDSQPVFVILATDGLWDTMSSQQAVDLVGRWIKWQADGAAKPLKSDTSQLPAPLLGMKHQCHFDEKRMTVQDSNAAVHLMRNAIGGDDDMTRAALTCRYPNSREVRDDITVQVVMFGSSKPQSAA